MAIDKLGDCGCLRKLEKDMISESLRTNLNVTRDILRGETAKLKQDTEYIKRLKGQVTLILDMQTKVYNIQVCK